MLIENKGRAAFRTGADSPHRNPSPHSNNNIRTASPLGQVDERTSLLESEDGRIPSRTFTDEIDRDVQPAYDSGPNSATTAVERGMCVESAEAYG